MRNGYRFPLSSIVMMGMALFVILYVLAKTGLLAPIGSSFLLVFAITVVIAAIVCCVLVAMHRSGVHRLAEVRTRNGE